VHVTVKWLAFMPLYFEGLQIDSSGKNRGSAALYLNSFVFLDVMQHLTLDP
jgi:hypothetical protein